MKPIEEIGVDVTAIQHEAWRKERNRRRNFRKAIAKYLVKGTQSVFAGTKLMPRMRRIERALGKEAFNRQKKTGYKTLSAFLKSFK